MAVNYGELIDGAARSDSINQNGLIVDMEPYIKLLDEDSYFFEALTRKLGGGTETTKRWKHEFMTARLIPSYALVSAVSAANATTVYIAEYDRVKDDFSSILEQRTWFAYQASRPRLRSRLRMRLRVRPRRPAKPGRLVTFL